MLSEGIAGDILSGSRPGFTRSRSRLVSYRRDLWARRSLRPPAGVFSLRTDVASIGPGWARCTHRLQDKMSPAIPSDNMVPPALCSGNLAIFWLYSYLLCVRS